MIADVLFFRKGSTEVIVDLTFKNPELNESSVTVGMNEGMIVTTFVQVVQSGKVEEVKDFEIDTQKISFEGKHYCDFSV